MSMNLKIEEDTELLLQTPTWITYMCLSYDPLTEESDGGWEGVLRRYKMWVDHRSDGVWGTGDNVNGTIEDLEFIRRTNKDHIEALDALVKKHGSLTWYWM